MKNGLLILSLLLIIFGCRQKHESLEPESDTLTGGFDTTDLQRKLVFQDCNAIVVGEGVRLRSTSDTRSEVIEKLNTGTLLKIVKPGDRKVVLGKPDECNPDGYFWYEVIESGGKRGWIYGEFMYQLIVKGRNDGELDNVQKKILGAQFNFGAGQYSFGFASAGRRAVRYEDGDPKCVEYLIPFLYLNAEGSVYPLKFVPNSKNQLYMPDLTKEKGYFRFTRDGAFDDKLIAYRMEKDILQLTLARDLGEEDPYLFTFNLKPAAGSINATPADSGKEFIP